MIYVAELKNNVVDNVTVHPEDCIIDDPNCVIIGTENTVGIGYTYENGVFMPPPEDVTGV